MLGTQLCPEFVKTPLMLIAAAMVAGCCPEIVLPPPCPEMPPVPKQLMDPAANKWMVDSSKTAPKTP